MNRNNEEPNNENFTPLAGRDFETRLQELQEAVFASESHAYLGEIKQTTNPASR